MSRIICVGLGPGDPDLMSVKAARLLGSVVQVAYFRKAGRRGQARQIVEGLLAPGAAEFPMEYPVTTELDVSDPAYNAALARFYDEWTTKLVQLTRNGDVIVLCEGDPFLYGSFMHLHSRLQGLVPVEVVPGITGMSGCWTATGQPVVWGDDVLSVLPGTLPEQELAKRAMGNDALVFMKIGRNLAKIRRVLAESGRAEAAWLVEHGTMPNQKIARLVDVDDEACPYFAIIIVHGQGRRPEIVA
ncbi:precorrin-2 C(20)-methyltransferase [Aureimonas fodinaquatilis]|uniref:Precorrin-2 C(20)-methyltransferase n=1 Tax=Aureimonas fodinaquatilis TaxID=2565783 RepID=A0A5B0DRW7_9HYPH|nr:precorrin-2 C(20)-methyltransferase [Aureimonas fodinaquatilis]KAA0969547.1 precorrin-2 C(20)-methyltransferase [Aureimonas fodinaquatilis]